MVRLGEKGILDLKIGDTGAKRAYLGDVQVWPVYHYLEFWTEAHPVEDMDSWMDGTSDSGLYCVAEDVETFMKSLREYPDMTAIYDATGDRTIPVIPTDGGATVSTMASRDGEVGTCYINTDLGSVANVYVGSSVVGYAFIAGIAWSDDGTNRQVAWGWLIDADIEGTATFTYGSETHTVTKAGLYFPRAESVGFSGDSNTVITREYGVEEYTPIVTASYLTFSSPGAFTLRTNNGGQNWDGTLYSSVDGTAWSVWNGASTLASGAVEGVQQLLLRGTGNTIITGNRTQRNWILTGTSIRCDGNIETLLDYQTVAAGEHPEMADYCFSAMFKNCGGLVSAPDLMATTLVFGCYESMFKGCTTLTSTPIISAIEIAAHACAIMFADCTGLTSAQPLAATSIGTSGCRYMFSGCTGLTSAPALPATALGNGCYAYMFENCTGLTSLPDLPASTLHGAVYSNMFSGCANIKVSETQTGEYQTTYRIPVSGTSTTDGGSDTLNMFSGTGGTFTGSPALNTTYYLAAD